MKNIIKLNDEEVEVLGMKSGLDRAQQIIRENKLSVEDKKKVLEIYSKKLWEN